jgi:2-dehydropantoate 2-reductase
MTIAIIGCGAMGSLFGALLARAGHTVWMIDNHAERAQAMAASGIHVEAPGSDLHVAVNATTDPTAVPPPDCVLIFVKAYDTGAAADVASALVGPQTTVVTLQNGLGNVGILLHRFGADRVVAGATAHGATEIGPAHVRHAGVGPTVIGAATGKPTDCLTRLAAILGEAGFETEVTQDLTGAIWSKVVINCGINAVAALTRLPNGRLIEDAGASRVMRAAMEEAAAVATVKGITLGYCDPFERVQQVCRATAENLNSMLQDVLRRRRTEVDAINGAISREGDEHGVATPVNDALVALVGAIERGYGRTA